MLESTSSVESIQHSPREEPPTSNPAQQNPGLAPPIPIIELSTSYIQIAENVSSSGSSLLFKRSAELCGVGSPCPDGR
jgi:hypothetical protein